MQPTQNTNIPPPPAYSIPPRASTFPLWGKILLGCGGLLVVFVILLGLVLSRTLIRGRGLIQANFCVSNLRTAQRALNLYSQDYDETYPQAARWMDDMTPYVKNQRELYCPVARASNPKGIGYAFNSKLSGIKASKIASPLTTAVVYDSTDLTPNASDAVTSLPSPARHVYPGKPGATQGAEHLNIALYADGKVRLIHLDGSTTEAPDTNVRRNIFGGPRQKSK